MKRILLFLFFLSFVSFLQAQNGIIKGRVFNAINNEPIMFANVLIQELGTGATTDLDGNYEIRDLEPGIYNLSVSYIGYQDKKVFEIELTNSKPAIVDVAMEENVEQLEEVVVKASPFNKSEESPVSLRTIGAAEIRRNPGGAKDISRVIQSLPGVTSTASFRNDLIIRGGAPNENRFYIDDVEVPNINHFATQGASGGPVGLINVDFIREVDYFSGAFPANRGNALSSVFNFKQKNGRDDRIGFTASVGASDAGVTLEGPIGKKTTFLFSARQSYLQFLFKALDLPFLPTYNDFQTKWKFKIDDKNELYFVGLGAIDNFKLNLEANETEDQQFILDQLPVNEQWNYTNGLVYKRYQEKGYWTFVLSRNMLNNTAYKYAGNDDSDESNKILDYKSQEIENKLRIESTQRVGNFKFNYGVGYEYAKYNNRTFNRISVPFQTEPLEINYASEFNMHKYGLFGQVSRKLLEDRMVLSLGVRADGNSYSKEMANPFTQLSPRFSLSYAFNDWLALNLNSGLFYQLPPYTVLGYQENGQFVNKQNEVKYIQNTHVVGGLEFNTGANSKVTVEGYAKFYDKYPFLLRDSLNLANLGGDFGVIGNEAVSSDKKGRTYGTEVLFQQKMFKGFYGIMAYTLGWSQFEDKNGDFVASSWDSRHIISLTAGKRFKKNWELGINWRMQSALPYTPYDEFRSALASNWDITGRGLLDYDLLNTQRATAAHTLDFRVDKKWFFNKWSFNLFLDIENVYMNSVQNQVLLLDKDENGMPQYNPTDPSRYLLKEITSGTGTLLPTIGLVIQY